MKIGKIIKAVGGYISSLLLALVFALFMSGRVGWFFIAAFLCAPLISLLLTLIIRSRIYAYAQLSGKVLNKGDSFEVSITVGNSSIFPTPPVKMEFYDNPCVSCSDKKYTVSVMPFAEETFEVKYNAHISGPSRIGTAKVCISDYFGIFSFSLPKVDMNELQADVAVIPDVADISGDTPFISKAMVCSAQADDSEDTAEAGMLTFGGFPGYESRDYVPGDPLKRINWKQSVKRDRLLVRLDDEAVISSVNIVLDSVFAAKKLTAVQIEKLSDSSGIICTSENAAPIAAQCCVENALGAAKTLSDRKYSINFLMYHNNSLQIYPVKDENDINMIRTELACYKFSENAAERFPEEELMQLKGSVCIFMTPFADGGLETLLSDYMGTDGQKGAVSVILSAVMYDSTFSGEVSV